MVYLQQQAHLNLRDCVRCYWKLENTSQQPLNFTIMPDGFFDLLICYHNDKFTNLFLTGLWTKQANVVILPNTKIYGIQFRLLAVENVIQNSIAPILNNMQTLEKTYWDLNRFVGNNDSDFFEYFNHHLISSMEKRSPIPQKKLVLLNSITQSKGNKTVTYYSEKASWSARQINRYFQKNFGLSLKTYCTLRKAAASFSQIKNGYLYPKQNYFDQPHFIKEIKKITGYTPKELKKNENDRFLQFSIIKTK